MLSIEIRCVNSNVIQDDIKKIEQNCRQALGRLVRSIHEVLITLSDCNGPRGGVDKQCCIQLRFITGGRVVVKAKGLSFLHAANVANDKVQQVAVKHMNKRRSSILKKPIRDLQSEIKLNYKH